MLPSSAASQEMFDLFEQTPDLVCIAKKDGFFQNINPAVGKTLGYSKEELLSLPIATFIHPDDKEFTAKRRLILLEGNPLLNFQNRYCTRNGDTVWLEWTSVYIPEKEVVFAIAKNITERKKEELAIEKQYQKFRDLTSHFKNSIEKDKKFLAIELHEELAQLTSVIKMDLDLMSMNVGAENSVLKSRIEHALSTANLLLNKIRRISFSISPNMIDDLGLHEVLNWLCNQFVNLNGIPCRLHCNMDESLLSREIQLDIFRICQDVLSNTLYHAAANNVSIQIEANKNKVLLTIEDDYSEAHMPTEKQRQLLENIRFRAASVNGYVHSETLQDKGTKIFVEINNA